MQENILYERRLIESTKSEGYRENKFTEFSINNEINDSENTETFIFIFN